MGLKVAPDKVAIYIRWSTEDQSQGHTLEIQRESCRYYCLSQGWVVRDDATFIDDGFSGSSLNRPALTCLRKQVEAGEIQCVVVYKLDRLSRNIKDIINLVLDEWEQLCCVRSTQEPVDTSNDAGRMFFTMLGSFADFERATIKARTWSGKLKNAEKGLNPGIRHPYGYTKGEGSTFAIQDEEATIVREVYDMYLKGWSATKIASELNHRGIPSRFSRGWATSTIAKILRNPIYTGRLVYNQQTQSRSKSGPRRVKNEMGTVVTVEGAAPPIVLLETWEKARRIAESRPRVGRSGSPRTEIASFLLTGMARCKCGHSVSGYYSSKGRTYYFCAGAHAKGTCDAGMISVADLDRVVVQRIQEGWPLRGNLREQVLARIQRQVDHQDAQMELVRRRLAELERSMERFKRDYVAGKLEADMYSELTRDSRKEFEQLADRMRALQETKDGAGSLQVDLALAEETFAQFDQWETLGPLERKRILQQLLSRVVVYRDRKSRELTVQCEWRLPAPPEEEPEDGERAPA